MYYEKDVEAVYYVYAKFADEEPNEVEALVTVELSYDKRKSGSAYHVYNWSIIDGKGLVTLEEENDSCKITAIESGKVKVKYSYSYTKDSTNVLTGNSEKKQEIDTEIYEIIIK